VVASKSSGTGAIYQTQWHLETFRCCFLQNTTLQQLDTCVIIHITVSLHFWKPTSVTSCNAVLKLTWTSVAFFKWWAFSWSYIHRKRWKQHTSRSQEYSG